MRTTCGHWKQLCQAVITRWSLSRKRPGCAEGRAPGARLTHRPPWPCLEGVLRRGPAGRSGERGPLSFFSALNRTEGERPSPRAVAAGPGSRSPRQGCGVCVEHPSLPGARSKARSPPRAPVAVRASERHGSLLRPQVPGPVPESLTAESRGLFCFKTLPRVRGTPIWEPWI